MTDYSEMASVIAEDFLKSEVGRKMLLERALGYLGERENMELLQVTPKSSKFAAKWESLWKELEDQVLNRYDRTYSAFKAGYEFAKEEQRNKDTDLGQEYVRDMNGYCPVTEDRSTRYVKVGSRFIEKSKVLSLLEG